MVALTFVLQFFDIWAAPPPIQMTSVMSVAVWVMSPTAVQAV